MDDLTVIGNLVEAGLWMVFTAALATMACRAAGPRRRLWTILSCAFFVFALSDVVESRTGAWWRPWWLLIMKTSCVAVFLYGVRQHLRLTASERASRKAPPPSAGGSGPADDGAR